MKKIFIPILLLLIIAASCKKDNTPSPDGNQTPLVFSSLTVADTVIAVNATTTITAVAVGDELTYNWSYSGGVIIGSGDVVQFTVCHSDKFKITCEVKDKYNNSETKDVYIKVK
jgi:hypothetical protein